MSSFRTAQTAISQSTLERTVVPARLASPVWAPDGGEVFFLEGTQLMAVTVQTDAGFTHSRPTALFDGGPRYLFDANTRNYDVSPVDGRFLMIMRGGQTDEDAPAAEINVVLNWAQELLERVPIN